VQAIILAGGFGTRLKSVVSSLPKPMACVNGIPFLESLLTFWVEQGIESFFLTVHYRWEAIRDHFGDTFRGASIHYVVESEPLGTGGAILNAESSLDGSDPYLILNGDTFFEIRLEEMLTFHRKNLADITVALASVPRNDRYSEITVQPDGRILSFKPQGPSENGLVNGGVYLVNALKGGPVRRASLETEIFPELIARGRRCFGFRSKGRFIDIGVPEDYRRAKSVLPQL
jgi:D-glycero-alpha-D-manno-heptose 1-phosphate guanylyltransferase